MAARLTKVHQAAHPRRRGGRGFYQKYAYQIGIPADVHDQFSCRKKYQISSTTSERDKSERLVLQLVREFKLKVAQRENGTSRERIEPPQVTVFAGDHTSER